MQYPITYSTGYTLHISNVTNKKNIRILLCKPVTKRGPQLMVDQQTRAKFQHVQL
jgi:hypothetical protein